MFTDFDTDKSSASWIRTQGANFRIGSFSVSIKLRVAGYDLTKEISDLYGLYPQENASSLPDITIALRYPNVLRTFFRPQLQASVNGCNLSKPEARHLGVPILEGGLNWFISLYTNRFLLLHAAVVERDGMAVVMPGRTGVGKSTLCAALLGRGWRLLSDEFTMVRPKDGRVQPHPRPISLKNSSIGVIERRIPEARFSKRYEGTAKGTLAYMRAPPVAIEKAEQTARPVLVVFPRYEPGARAELIPLDKAQAFMHLIGQSSNYYTMLGTGFETLATFVEACDHYALSYPTLDEAISKIESVYSVPRDIEHVD